MKRYKSIEQGQKKLWYEQNFKDWLKKNNHLPDSVLNLITKIQQKGESVSDESVEITCIDINQEDNVLFSKSFKVTVEGKPFFLKIENESIADEGAFQEMESTLLAKEELNSLNKYGTRVIEPLWGYENQIEHQSYFVAEWLDFPILDDYLQELNKAKVAEILERVKNIQKILDGYREVSPANMFYDKEKNEIILFDLHV